MVSNIAGLGKTVQPMSQVPRLSEDVSHPASKEDMGATSSKQAPATSPEPAVKPVPAAADSLLSAGDAGQNGSSAARTTSSASPGAKEKMATPLAPAPFIPIRHNLPQIPTMSHSRLAVSKASSRKQVLKINSTFLLFPRNNCVLGVSRVCDS